MRIAVDPQVRLVLIQVVIHGRDDAYVLDPRLVLIVLDGELALAGATDGTQRTLCIIGELLRYGTCVLRCLFDHRRLQLRQTVILIVQVPFIGGYDDALLEQVRLFALACYHQFDLVGRDDDGRTERIFILRTMVTVVVVPIIFHGDGTLTQVALLKTQRQQMLFHFLSDIADLLIERGQVVAVPSERERPNGIIRFHLTGTQTLHRHRAVFIRILADTAVDKQASEA